MDDNSGETSIILHTLLPDTTFKQESKISRGKITLPSEEMGTTKGLLLTLQLLFLIMYTYIQHFNPDSQNPWIQ